MNICNEKEYREDTIMATITTSIDLVATGETIKNMIKQSGYTVKNIQTLLGLTYPQTIYKWQNGESLPDYENLFALAKLLNVSIEELIQHKYIITEDEHGESIQNDHKAFVCLTNNHAA